MTSFNRIASVKARALNVTPFRGTGVGEDFGALGRHSPTCSITTVTPGLSPGDAELPMKAGSPGS